MSRRAVCGFTLIELLIALALVAITLTIGFAALRFAGRSLERTDVLTRDAEEIRVLSQVLEQQLSQARPLLREVPQRQPAFRGEPAVVEFVAPAPVQEGRLAGLYHYRLRFAAADGATQLVLDYQPYAPSGSFDWDGQHESAVLVRALAGGGFSYFGAARPQAHEEWGALWQGGDSLPLLVRLELRRGTRAVPWPALVVPLRAHQVR